MNGTPVTIPKSALPDCEVGETLKIVSEEGENFIIEPEYEAAPAPPSKGDPKMKGHAPAVAIVISGGRGGKKST